MQLVFDPPVRTHRLMKQLDVIDRCHGVLPLGTHIGVRRGATGSGLEYHAWLTVAGECLVGIGETKTWAPLQPFGGNDTTAETADGSGR